MRVYWLLYYPQALDDANKGIIDELKKTNYRDLFREKKEKGEFLEPLRTQLRNFPSAFSSVIPGPRLPGACPVPGCSTAYEPSDFSATGSPCLSLGQEREAILPTSVWGLSPCCLPREPTPALLQLIQEVLLSTVTCQEGVRFGGDRGSAPALEEPTAQWERQTIRAVPDWAPAGQRRSGGAALL